MLGQPPVTDDERAAFLDELDGRPRPRRRSKKAATRGGIAITSDVDDLEHLRAFFPAVRVLGLEAA